MTFISVLIATHGDDAWRDLAWSRAYPTAADQADEVLVVHEPDKTLAQTRNILAGAAFGDYLCFLDADDELAPGFIDLMKGAIAQFETAGIPGGALFTPMVSSVGGGRRATEPFFHEAVPPEQGNWLVIGTVVPAALFHEVGGFEEWPIYEDWALFARMQKAGAAVVRVHGAVYRAWKHRRPGGARHGRNHALDRDGKIRVHAAIRAAIYPELAVRREEVV